MSRVTLDDVAKLAGVSKATASRVLNHPELVRPETRAQVRRAIERSGYRVAAGGLVALVVPDRKNPFFTELGVPVQENLSRHGLGLVTLTADEGSDGHKQLEMCRELGIGGVILISPTEPTAPAWEALQALDVPVVLLDREIQRAHELPCVTTDNREGMIRAVDYLAAHGHQRIAHLAGPEHAPTARERRHGFEHAMRLNGLPPRERWIWEGDFSLAAGLDCAEAILSSRDRPSAIVCANDLMAIGLMRGMQESGCRLPEDLSVIGFDNVAGGAWVHPSLTTISQRMPLMVRFACDMLADALCAPDHRPSHIPMRVPPVLVPRASVASPLPNVRH